MKCKYYRESLSWNTERMGAKGGSDSLFQVFTFRLPRLWETSARRQTEKVNAGVQERDDCPEVPQLSLRGDDAPGMKAQSETSQNTQRKARTRAGVHVHAFVCMCFCGHREKRRLR